MLRSSREASPIQRSPWLNGPLRLCRCTQTEKPFLFPYRGEDDHQYGPEYDRQPWLFLTTVLERYDEEWEWEDEGHPIQRAPWLNGPLRLSRCTQTEKPFLSPYIETDKYGPEYERQPWLFLTCLLYTSPSPRDLSTSRMPSSA